MGYLTAMGASLFGERFKLDILVLLCVFRNEKTHNLPVGWHFVQ